MKITIKHKDTFIEMDDQRTGSYSPEFNDHSLNRVKDLIKTSIEEIKKLYSN